MRIRLWNAFASNNSGSYTIVGYFSDAGRAEAVAELLRPLLAEHSAWLEQSEPVDEAPLHRFIREHGLTLDETSDWPEYGPPPEVVAVGQQVLVHCDYTVSMPRFLGELIYAQGGRVQLEVNHGHHATVVIFEFWLPWEHVRAQPDEARIEFANLLDALLAGPVAQFGSEAVPPAWSTSGHYPMLQVGVVFQNLIEGVRAVQALAASTRARVHLRVFEAPAEGGDPLAFLRQERRAIPGEHAVILWRPGPDRAATLKAVRAVMGGGLREAVALLDSLPAEVLSAINRRDAEEAVERLTAAGADAELLTPDDRRPR